MRITTKGRYGMRAIIYLALAYHNRPISISTIAEQEKVSSEFLEQIFFKLKKAGLIQSIRGPGGGFILGRKPAEVTMKDVLDAIGETGRLTPCTFRRKICTRTDVCNSHEIWVGLQEAIDGYLRSVTLKTIIEKNGKRFFEKLESNQDFTI